MVKNYKKNRKARAFLFWFPVASVIFTSIRKNATFKYWVVKQINLHACGTKVDVIVYPHIFFEKIPIEKITKPSSEWLKLAYFNKNHNAVMELRFLPIIIEGKELLINVKGRTNTPDVLPAILNGEHIDLSETFKDGQFLIYNGTSESVSSNFQF